MGIHISPLTAFDTFNLFAFVKKWNKCHNLNGKVNNDYTILCTTYNSSIPLKNIEFLNRYREKVIICDDRSNNQDFLNYLNQLEKEGYRIVRNGEKKFIKWEYLKKILEFPSRELALKKGLEIVETNFTIFLDDDSIPEDDLGKAVAILEEQDADIS